MTREQARHFLNAAKGDRLAALYLLAIHTGLRQGELLGLKWNDVDLDRGTLQVRRILSAAKEGPTFTTPKSNKGRSVRLTTQAVQAFTRSSYAAGGRETKHDGYWQDHSLVFTTLVGTPSTDTISLAGLSSRCSGMQDSRTYRSTAYAIASRRFMLTGGEHPKVVQEMMGHSGIRVTMDFYSHVLPDMQREAVDRLGVMLS